MNSTIRVPVIESITKANDELAAINETLLEHAAASTSEGASDVFGRRALAEARVKRFLDRSEKPSI